MSVAALGRAYRDGSLTPSAVVAAGLERLDRLEPVLNAFADDMREAVVREAEQRGTELSSGRGLGPLHGIPVAIKDLIDVAGVPTGYGSMVRHPRLATTDAVLVQRLREAGAIIFGKTNLLEYAYGVAHPQIGKTNNPHDTGRTSGGSSGGSAAAVAAGIVPLAVGTDTGGSIRIPASYCGIVGLKPTFGLVPTDGVFPLSPSLDHVGPLARTCTDAALALACLAGQPMPTQPIALKGLRIGIIRHHLEAGVVTGGVGDSVRAAIDRLKAAGAVTTDIEIPHLRDVNRQLVKLLLPEASIIHADLHAENAAGYAAGTRSQVEAGFAAKAVDYILAQRFRDNIRAAVEALFADVDVLLSPSVPFVAPVEDPEFIEGEDGEILSSGLSNVTGHPSISIPCGFRENLPVGLQLTGALGEDARLLDIAGATETLLDAYRIPPL